jgi:hypothetical protein
MSRALFAPGTAPLEQLDLLVKLLLVNRIYAQPRQFLRLHHGAALQQP